MSIYKTRYNNSVPELGMRIFLLFALVVNNLSNYTIAIKAYHSISNGCTRVGVNVVCRKSTHG